MRASNHKERPCDRKKLIRWLICLGVCGGAVGCKYWYPQGAQMLQQYVFGRDSEEIAAVFAAMEEHNGQSGGFGAIVEAFCGEVTP